MDALETTTIAEAWTAFFEEAYANVSMDPDDIQERKEIFYCGVVSTARALDDGRMNLEQIKLELKQTGPTMFTTDYNDNDRN